MVALTQKPSKLAFYDTNRNRRFGRSPRSTHVPE